MKGRATRAPVLRAVTVAYLVWSLAPIVIAIVMSFNRGSSVTTWEGFGLRWWIGAVGSQESIVRDPETRTALLHSILVAGVATAVAVPLGTSLALALGRWRSPIARLIDATLLIGLVSAPVMLAAAYWLLFAFPLRGFPFGGFGWFGTNAQAAALTTWSIPFVAILIRVRLLALDLEHEACAADLGAPPGDVVRRVILPQLAPVIAAALAMVFGLCMGEFVLTSALRAGDRTRTLAMALFGARLDTSPRFAVIGTTLAIAGVLGFAAVLLAFRGARSALGARSHTSR